MNEERFLKHPELPFAELRYSRNSGRHYKPHMHETFSIGAMDAGEVIYRIGGKALELGTRGLALINPETPHSCNPAGSGERSYYVLHLDVEWCRRLQQSLWRTDSFLPADGVLLKDNSVYEQFLDVMKTVMDKGNPRGKEPLLVDLAKRIFLRACEPAAAVGGPPPLVERLRRQLSENLDAGLPLDRLASRLKANPYTLLRRFKAATGMTPHAYRTNCRIELARKFLQQGLDISQVALECGFADQSHFHRNFKAITTVSPREYQVNFVQ